MSYKQIYNALSGNFDLVQSDLGGSPGGIGSFIWVEGTADMTIESFTGIVVNKPLSTLQIVLPTSARFGDWFRILGHSNDGWKLAVNPGQKIFYGLNETSTNTGYIEAIHSRASIEFICISENVGYSIISAVGTVDVL